MQEITMPFNHGILQSECPICGEQNTVIVQTDFEESCCHYRGFSYNGIRGSLKFDYVQATIFQYNLIQNIISKIPRRKIKKDFTSRLNSSNPQTVHSAEWELVVIDWLLNFGTISYEPQQKNMKRPDVDFLSDDGTTRFIADIATVSDTTLKKNFPALNFLLEMRKILHTELPLFNFNLNMTSATKNRPEMFPVSRFDINIKNFKDWLSGTKSAFSINTHHTFSAENNQIFITILSKDMSGNLSYPATTYSESDIHSNPIANLLSRKLSGQLLPHDDKLVGIFLCDGECMILNQMLYSYDMLKIGHIINNIFYLNHHIDFILTFQVQNIPTLPSLTGFTEYNNITINPYVNINSNKHKTTLLTALLNKFKENARLFHPVTLSPAASTQRINRKMPPGCRWIFTTD